MMAVKEQGQADMGLDRCAGAAPLAAVAGVWKLCVQGNLAQGGAVDGECGSAGETARSGYGGDTPL